METDGRDSIASLVYWLGPESYEPETIRVFLTLAEKSPVVFDIGANTGLYALLAAARRIPGQSVRAFEPVPGIFEFLRRNASINGFSSIVSECAALADFDGEIEIHVPDSNTFPTGSSSIVGYRRSSEAIRSPAVRLDSYARKNRLTRLDLLKIDTEATEPKVIDGAQQTIRRFRPWMICEVLAGTTEQALQERLTLLHYRYFLITDNGIVPKNEIEGDPKYECRNYLFAPEERLDELKSIGLYARA
jgi:FkbM family methyltransferase